MELHKGRAACLGMEMAGPTSRATKFPACAHWLPYTVGNLNMASAISRGAT